MLETLTRFQTEVQLRGCQPPSYPAPADRMTPVGLARCCFRRAARKNNLRQIVQSRPSNAMLDCGRTTPQDYPERSGFGRRREREWGHGGTCRRVDQEYPIMRVYIIGTDGITLCRTAPATLNNGEFAVASNEELRAGPTQRQAVAGAVEPLCPVSKSARRLATAMR